MQGRWTNRKRYERWMLFRWYGIIACQSCGISAKSRSKDVFVVGCPKRSPWRRNNWIGCCGERRWGWAAFFIVMEERNLSGIEGSCRDIVVRRSRKLSRIGSSRRWRNRRNKEGRGTGTSVMLRTCRNCARKRKNQIGCVGRNLKPAGVSYLHYMLSSSSVLNDSSVAFQTRPEPLKKATPIWWPGYRTDITA